MEKKETYLDSFPGQESTKDQRVTSDQRLSDFQLLKSLNLPGVKFKPSRMGDITFDQMPLPPDPDVEIDADT